MGKKMTALLSLLLIMAAMLCGCHNNSDDAGTSEGLAKDEWIGLLGDKFGYNDYESTDNFYSDVAADNVYYNEIQACAEWEILPEQGTLEPDNRATWQYAIETAVRAIGIDKINSAEIGVEVTEDNLVEFFTSKIANVDAESLDMELTETDADLILVYAYDYATSLTLPERMEFTYNDGVTEVSADAITLKGDGVTALVRDGSSYKEGDVIYIEPSDESEAYAMRVNAVDGDRITYEQAGMEDIYQELQISGTYEATIIDVEPAEGVNISFAKNTSERDFYAVNTLVSLPKATTMENKEELSNTVFLSDKNESGNKKIKFNTKTKQEASLEVTISDITATPDVDFGILAGLKKADITLSFKDEVIANYKIEATATSEQIPLGNVKVRIGATPLTVKFYLVANLGFNGEVTLSYSSKIVTNVNYQKGRGLSKSVSNNDADCKCHADATVTVEPSIKVDFCCLERSLANAKVTTGVVAIATADIDLLGDQPACIDVYLYMPLRWAINEDSCVMTDLNGKLKASAVVWDSENSPINMRFHWEDGVLVEACTRGDKVETEPVDEEGEPYDEYKIFDFEEVVFGFIKVASQSLYLSDGETMTIGILALPDGYRMADLSYQVENSSVCSAGGGSVTAVGSGSTTLQIATSDGKYKVYLTVVVEAEYNDTSNFQPL